MAAALGRDRYLTGAEVQALMVHPLKALVRVAVDEPDEVPNLCHAIEAAAAEGKTQTALRARSDVLDRGYQAQRRLRWRPDIGPGSLERKKS